MHFKPPPLFRYRRVTARHLSCYYRGCVNFYDILQDGFHTPLNADQIADLFYAGRLGRNTPCKRAEKKEWRTIDELFPLLKYDSSRRFVYQSGEAGSRLERRRDLVMPACFAGAVGISLILWFAFHDSGSANHVRPPTETSSVIPAPPLRIWTNSGQPIAPAPQHNKGIAIAEAPTQQIDNQVQLRQAEERRRAQILAELKRANDDRRQRELQKAAGRDQHVLLDHLVLMNVGGSSVSVKIHDNDTTSFDVWINGDRFRDMKKQKGITGSGTDETLIYRNGRAALYYVWEISGKIDHCLLRIRDS